MPSKTFLQLPKAKQTGILYSATLEFIANPYETASVVRICQQAGIPRATFYSYFSGLADIFTHTYNLIAEQCVQSPEENHSCSVEYDNVNWLTSRELEDYFVNLTNSRKGMTLLYASINQAPSKDRIFNHAMLSLLKQYQLKGISRQQLKQQVASMSTSLKATH